MAARVYDEVFGYIEDATKTLPGAPAPGELPTLTYRRATGDMIETYKLLSGKYDDKASQQLKSKMSSLPSDYKTRGNSRELEVRRCSTI